MLKIMALLKDSFVKGVLLAIIFFGVLFLLEFVLGCSDSNILAYSANISPTTDENILTGYFNLRSMVDANKVLPDLNDLSIAYIYKTDLAKKCNQFKRFIILPSYDIQAGVVFRLDLTKFDYDKINADANGNYNFWITDENFNIIPYKVEDINETDMTILLKATSTIEENKFKLYYLFYDCNDYYQSDINTVDPTGFLGYIYETDTYFDSNSVLCVYNTYDLWVSKIVKVSMNYFNPSVGIFYNRPKQELPHCDLEKLKREEVFNKRELDTWKYENLNFPGGNIVATFVKPSYNSNAKFKLNKTLSENSDNFTFILYFIPSNPPTTLHLTNNVYTISFNSAGNVVVEIKGSLCTFEGETTNTVVQGKINRLILIKKDQDVVILLNDTKTNHTYSCGSLKVEDADNFTISGNTSDTTPGIYAISYSKYPLSLSSFSDNKILKNATSINFTEKNIQDAYFLKGVINDNDSSIILYDNANKVTVLNKTAVFGKPFGDLFGLDYNMEVIFQKDRIAQFDEPIMGTSPLGEEVPYIKEQVWVLLERKTETKAYYILRIRKPDYSVCESNTDGAYYYTANTKRKLKLIKNGNLFELYEGDPNGALTKIISLTCNISPTGNNNYSFFVGDATHVTDYKVYFAKFDVNNGISQVFDFENNYLFKPLVPSEADPLQIKYLKHGVDLHDHNFTTTITYDPQIQDSETTTAPETITFDSNFLKKYTTKGKASLEEGINKRLFRLNMPLFYETDREHYSFAIKFVPKVNNGQYQYLYSERNTNEIYLSVAIDPNGRIFSSVRDENANTLTVYSTNKVDWNKENTVVVVRDGNVLKVYLNGVLTEASNAQIGKLHLKPGYEAQIGKNYAYSNYFQGDVYEASLYKIALTEADVNEIIYDKNFEVEGVFRHFSFIDGLTSNYADSNAIVSYIGWQTFSGTGKDLVSPVFSKEKNTLEFRNLPSGNRYNLLLLETPETVNFGTGDFTIHFAGWFCPQPNFRVFFSTYTTCDNFGIETQPGGPYKNLVVYFKDCDSGASKNAVIENALDCNYHDYFIIRKGKTLKVAIDDQFVYSGTDNLYGISVSTGDYPKLPILFARNNYYYDKRTIVGHPARFTIIKKALETVEDLNKVIQKMNPFPETVLDLNFVGRKDFINRLMYDKNYYYQLVAITNNDSSDWNNAVIWVDLDSSNFDFSKIVDSDGKDVFIATDPNDPLNTEIPSVFWWVDKENQKARVFFKVSIPAGETKTYYLMYGSNDFIKERYSDVFKLWDHFDGDSLNTSLWDTIASGVSYSVSNSIVTVTTPNGTNSDSGIDHHETSIDLRDSLIITRRKLHSNTATPSYHAYFGLGDNTPDTYGNYAARWDTYRNHGSGDKSEGFVKISNAWYNEFSVSGETDWTIYAITTNVDENPKYYKNDSLVAQATHNPYPNIPQGGQYLVLDAHYSANGTLSMDIDWIIVTDGKVPLGDGPLWETFIGPQNNNISPIYVRFEKDVYEVKGTPYKITNETQNYPIFNLKGIFEEDSWSPFNIFDKNAQVNLTITCPSGVFSADLNEEKKTKFKLPLKEIPISIAFKISQEGVDWRRTTTIYDNAKIKNFELYLVDLNKDGLIYPTFEIIDLLGLFSADDYIFFQKLKSGNSVEITSLRLNNTKTISAFLKPGCYIVSLCKKDNSFCYNAGWYCPLETKTYKVNIMPSEYSPKEGFYKYFTWEIDANTDNNNYRIILKFYKKSEQVKSLSYKLYDCNDQVVFSLDKNGDELSDYEFASATVCVGPDCPTCRCYKYRLVVLVDENNGNNRIYTTSNYFCFARGQIFTLSLIPLDYFAGFGILSIPAFVLLISPAFWEIAILSVPLAISFFSWLGWISLPPLLYFFIWFLAIIAILAKRKYFSG